MNIDKKLESIANKVINKMEINNSTEPNSQSVILVIMIISVILSLIRVIQECNKKKLNVLSNNKDKAQFMQDQVKTICVKKNLLNQWRLNRILKQKLSKTEYEAFGNKLKTAIMDVGVDLTEDELSTLMEATNNV